MQAVGIQGGSGLSALGSNPSGQMLRQLFDADVPTLQMDDKTLDKPVMVGAYTSPLVSLDGVDVDKSLHSRNLAFAITAVQSIERCIRQMSTGLPTSRLAVVLGTSTSGISDNQTLLASQMQSAQTPKLPYARQAMNALAQGVAQYLGFGGLSYTISTACSSSGKALATAMRLLNGDMADVVVAGGVDTLCPLTLNGFNSLDSLSAGICTPCGDRRDGINIGEAASVFVLSRERADVLLLGAGESMDAYHISAPHPQGRGAEQAMARALAQAKLSTHDIDYINMHGTATPHNDAMEIQAIRRLFGVDTPISSTKHKTGHCLGAASAIEAYLCYELLKSGDWLPAHHTGVLDGALADMNYVKPHNTTKVSTILSNSFAFGGSNVALVLGRGST